jgi:crotonobetainyl-CoA:carnitine CoA-transferase CaiB-like acyl-CoA transferase
MLGDLGAEVIKIEERVRGDGGRAVMRFDSGKSPYWEFTNRNKKSVAVDLHTPEGVEIVRSLVANSDVFTHNFRPSIAEKLGLDYETLSRSNRRLIYASASAFGPDGPEATSRGYDLTGQARSGLLLQDENSAQPSHTDAGLADQMGAIMLAYGVLAGLMARERHGVGQRVDTSLLGSMLWLRALPVALELMKENDQKATIDFAKFRASNGPYDRTDPGNPLWNTFKCSDGKWLALAILASDPLWPTVLEALSNPSELSNDDRFVDHVSRCVYSRELTTLLDQIFATHPRDYWLQRLLHEGDLPVCAVNTTLDAVQDPQAIINGYVTDLDHPTYGRIRTPGIPIKLSATPARIHKRAPEFGEHTEDVLCNVLGMGWDEIIALRHKAVI